MSLVAIEDLAELHPYELVVYDHDGHCWIVPCLREAPRLCPHGHVLRPLAPLCENFTDPEHNPMRCAGCTRRLVWN